MALDFAKARMTSSLAESEKTLGEERPWAHQAVELMVKWPLLSRQAWIVLVILDMCAISTTLSGIWYLFHMNPAGIVYLATGAGFLWYVSRPILKGKSPGL